MKLSERGVRAARALLAALFFAGYGAGSLVLGCVLLPLLLLFGGTRAARRTLRAAVRAAYRFFVRCARVTGLFTVRLAGEDRARLAGLRGCVIAANHLTLIDVVILLALLPETTAVAKAAAGRNFFYALIVRRVFLSNADPARVLAEARELLAAGVNVLVFPEGTRTPPEATERKLHRGAARIALDAGVPVACLHLTCDPPVLDKRRPWYDVGARTIVYTISFRGTLHPGEPPSRAAAIRLTDSLRHTLFP